MKKIKLFICVVLVTMFTSLLSGCAAVVRLPKVKEGRFDFSVTYEINGEEYVENGEENGVMPIQINEDGIIYIDFYFVPEYFMGDPDAILFDVPAPALYIVYHDDDPDSASYETDQEILATNYGVRLISYKYADPIENAFEEKLTFVDFELTIN